MSSSSDNFNKTNPIAVIRSILDGYPFGVGIFREFLQNSDDARASKQVCIFIRYRSCRSQFRNFVQIFLLDNQRHPVDVIHHGNLSNTQGPALIAYNDAVFHQTDWEALQAMYQSSKKKDTSFVFPLYTLNSTDIGV
jgi:glutamine phosphoribosylpyrophosphate amidotransferase